MKEKLPKIFLVAILLLIIGNLGFLNYQWWRSNKETETELETEKENGENLFFPSSSLNTSEGQAEKGDCSAKCQELIDQKIAAALTGIPTQKPSKSSSGGVLTVPTQSQTKVSYVPLIAETTINSVDWKDITPSDFYFDLTDYPNIKNVRFEVYLKSQHQAGKVFVRLYDVTNKRAVDYSDLSSSLETFELQRSSDLTIWRGNNLYRLQGRTQSGIEGYLKDAKLRITF